MLRRVLDELKSYRLESIVNSCRAAKNAVGVVPRPQRTSCQSYRQKNQTSDIPSNLQVLAPPEKGRTSPWSAYTDRCGYGIWDAHAGPIGKASHLQFRRYRTDTAQKKFLAGPMNFGRRSAGHRSWSVFGSIFETRYVAGSTSEYNLVIEARPNPHAIASPARLFVIVGSAANCRHQSVNVSGSIPRA